MDGVMDLLPAELRPSAHAREHAHDAPVPTAAAQPGEAIGDTQTDRAVAAAEAEERQRYAQIEEDRRLAERMHRGELLRAPFPARQ